MDSNPLPLSLHALRGSSPTGWFHAFQRKQLQPANFATPGPQRFRHKRGTQAPLDTARKYLLASMAGCEKLHPTLQPYLFWCHGCPCWLAKTCRCQNLELAETHSQNPIPQHGFPTLTYLQCIPLTKNGPEMDYVISRYLDVPGS